MRILSSLTTRRSAIAACCAFSLMEIQRPARALVDGIPLYAPGDQFALPDVGFETLLPRLESIRDVELTGTRGAIVRGDLSAAAISLDPKGALARQLEALGSTASILGDDAYTALSIKAKYASSAKRLLARLSATTSSEAELLQEVGQLEASFEEFLALIPPVVVKQVRAREKRLTNLASGITPSEPEVEPTTAAASSAPKPVGGLLMTPNGGGQVCGRDIRC
jgi:hypothetical protein